MSLSNIAQLIKKSQHIVLTTHRQCDGDGLGCELSLYFALKKIGKDVQIINVDATPKKYRFLNPDQYIQYFDQNTQLPKKIDLVLIFDTNDQRLVEPLFSQIQPHCKDIYFIDHHPLLQSGPRPIDHSYIDMQASSTGEVVFDLIQELNIDFDINMARALYTSVTFDTQLYRFIRQSPRPHLVAAHLLQFPIQSNDIHRYLFSHQTVNKISFMSKIFGQLEYYAGGKLACVVMSLEDMQQHGLDFDEVRDVTDQIMSIDSIEIAFVIRQDQPNNLKISLRSKGIVEVLTAAESIGGGGHWYSAGGSYQGDLTTLKNQILNRLCLAIDEKAPKQKVP